MSQGSAHRRVLIVASLLVVAACGRGGSDDVARTASPAATAAATAAPTAGAAAKTPDCEPQGAFTPAQTEGPYFKANSPEKSNLFADVRTGTRLVLSGWVLATDCAPVSRAKLDFWQADANGNYDQQGFTLRGHQFTDEAGRYRLITVDPARYPGRTRHIHVKVQPPTGIPVTTQLYFPDDPQNEDDSIFDPDLVMDVRDAKNGKAATFNFVVVIG